MERNEGWRKILQDVGFVGLTSLAQ
jgi:hypothetical protein